MARWRTIAVAVGGALVGGAATAAALGRFAWSRATERAVRRLADSVGEAPSAVFSLETLGSLPDPVARYFRFALTPTQPLVRSARFEQRGEFRAGGRDAPWSPLAAVQHVSAEPPGFVWDAAIRMAPLVTVRVRDTYGGGIAAMQGNLAGLFTVVNVRDHPELAAGALHRYLAEAVWLPTALLPSQRLRWEPIDDRSARATLTDAGTTVSLTFEFGADGAITRAFTPERFREVSGTYRPTPWACVYREYETVAGMRVPMWGEVEWVLPEGPLPYWRGRILAPEYRFGAGR